MEQKEFEKRLKPFVEELKQLCFKHKIDIRAKIEAYGPVLEFFLIEEQNAEIPNQNQQHTGRTGQ